MSYDVAVVGGGLAGAAAARSMALAGARVVLLERERHFKDRVRGDMVYPWGVAELARLGLHDLVRASVATEIATWTNAIEGLPPRPRHFPSTTPSGLPALGFFHPELQELLLREAESAGADVRRGATVVGVTPGHSPLVTVARPRSVSPGGAERIEARLVVGADGRGSKVRAWAGFPSRRDRDRLVLAGALFRGSSAPADEAYVHMVPGRGTVAISIPLGKGRHRVYGGYELRGGRRQLSGAAALPDFLALLSEAGAPEEWLSDAELAGPLAAFDGADSWVDRPYADGVVLLGDAAATSDPSFGSGVSLALRDARVLGEAVAAALRSGEDLVKGAQAYAEEHDRYYGALHRRIDWLTMVLRETGAAADGHRRRVLPYFVSDPARVPDVVGQGPDGPSDEAARRRFFGEE